MSESNEKDVTMQPALVNPNLTNCRIVMENADGGAILAMIDQQNPARKLTAVVAGDRDSAAFQRKVQRTVVKWVKEFFPAPPRKGSKAAADIEAEESTDPTDS